MICNAMPVGIATSHSYQLLSVFVNRHMERVQHFSALDWAQMVLPCISWLRVYSIKEQLPVGGRAYSWWLLPPAAYVCHE
jgi:hypothetical protein